MTRLLPNGELAIVYNDHVNPLDVSFGLSLLLVAKGDTHPARAYYGLSGE
jgi:hypothetical protein